MNAATPLLEAQDLGRCKSGRWLVRHASLAIGRGDRLVLQGPTAAGKSVLLRLLSALDAADEGQLLWHGHSLADDQAPRFRRSVAYCAQRPVFLPGTVEENLQAVLSLRVNRQPLDRERAAALLESAGKSPDLLRAESDHLSGGEQLIAALLRTLLLAPELLLLDEPTAALDEKSVAEVERLIDSWMNESPARAFLWITHSSQQASRVGRGRVLQMAEGRLQPAPDEPQPAEPR